jgi:hypothetical protein
MGDAARLWAWQGAARRGACVFAEPRAHARGQAGAAARRAGRAASAVAAPQGARRLWRLARLEAPLLRTLSLPPISLTDLPGAPGQQAPPAHAGRGREGGRGSVAEAGGSHVVGRDGGTAMWGGADSARVRGGWRASARWGRQQFRSRHGMGAGARGCLLAGRDACGGWRGRGGTLDCACAPRRGAPGCPGFHMRMRASAPRRPRARCLVPLPPPPPRRSAGRAALWGAPVAPGQRLQPPARRGAVGRRHPRATRHALGHERGHGRRRARAALWRAPPRRTQSVPGGPTGAPEARGRRAGGRGRKSAPPPRAWIHQPARSTGPAPCANEPIDQQTPRPSHTRTPTPA